MNKAILKNILFIFVSNILYMLSKAQIKHIRSLEAKKERYVFKEYVIEGIKLIQEALENHTPIVKIYVTAAELKYVSKSISSDYIEIIEPFEMEKISGLQTPPDALAVVNMLENPTPTYTNKITLILDSIRDPGNLGTIIRIADWYGIQQIICSLDSTDCYNQKVVQASMGSLFRIPVYYQSLAHVLSENKNINAYATVLEGKDINTLDKLAEGFIVIGNESHGISQEVLALCNTAITIKNKGKAESLNAAVACGIICHQLLS